MAAEGGNYYGAYYRPTDSNVTELCMVCKFCRQFFFITPPPKPLRGRPRAYGGAILKLLPAVVFSRNFAGKVLD